MSKIAFALMLTFTAAGSALAAVDQRPFVQTYNQTFDEPADSQMLFDRAKGSIY